MRPSKAQLTTEARPPDWEGINVMKHVSSRQIEHVRRAMVEEFGSLVNMSDVGAHRTDERERRLHSRSFAALAVRSLVDCNSEAAADAVIDGRDDQGIDAIAFGDGTPEMFLIQAKWSDKGTAGIKADHARALVDGFRQLEERRFNRFNDRFTRLKGRVDDILQNSKSNVTLVFVVMGEGHLAAEVAAILDDACNQYNDGPDKWLGYRVLTGQDMWSFVRSDMKPPPIRLSVPMSQWLRRNEPTESYLGTVSAEEVAQWYGKYSNRLFDGNVRKALGLTSVNQGMVNTLVNDPVSFWSKNNGITLLCSDLEARYFGSRRAANEPVTLDLRDARVVNGAQTVSAIYRAMQEDPQAACQADVSVRVICVSAGAGEFGIGITQGTNTQNRIEGRDFIALDPVQGDIRDDFELALGLSYVFQRGDTEPTAETGCSVVEAARALACAHRNSDLAVRAKQNPETLWEQSAGGAYPMLFGNQPSALQIWRSVRLFRATREAVSRESRKLRGRASTIADHGDHIVANVIFRLVDWEKIEDPEVEWDDEVAWLVAHVGTVLRWLVVEVDGQFGTGSFVTSTFANPQKCRDLVKGVLAHARAGDPPPQLLDGYTPTKAPARVRARSTVHVLLDAAHLEDGTPLRYVPDTSRERVAMDDWMQADPRRARATWVSDRRRPILWEADGKQYSPSGLVMHMWQQAEWEECPASVRGPKCWHVGNEGSLADLAAAIQQDVESNQPLTEAFE